MQQSGSKESLKEDDNLDTPIVKKSEEVVSSRFSRRTDVERLSLAKGSMVFSNDNESEKGSPEKKGRRGAFEKSPTKVVRRGTLLGKARMKESHDGDGRRSSAMSIDS